MRVLHFLPEVRRERERNASAHRGHVDPHDVVDVFIRELRGHASNFTPAAKKSFELDSHALEWHQDELFGAA